MDIPIDTIEVGRGPRSAWPPEGDSSPAAIQELLDAIPLALAIVDDDLRCVGLNQRMAAKFGSGAEMCLGRPVCEIVPPIAAQLETRLRRVLAGDTVEDSALRGWSDHSAVGRGEIHSFAVLRNESGALAGVLWTARDDGPGVSVSRSAPDTEKWRILMAEDLPMNQQIIAEMLESAGFEVLIVADGASAVNLVRRESIDLVLMDIEMPLMGGLEAARAIRALGAAGGVPVVAMTANQGPEQIAACRAAGMDAYICKPVDRAYLLSTVRKWLKNSRKPLPNGRTERDNVLDRGVLENIRVHFGSLRTQRFIHEVNTRLDYVLLQLSAEAGSKQLGNDLHSLVSMGGHLGLRELSERARSLMVAMRGQANNIGVVTEEFRSAAVRALAALQQEDLPRGSHADRDPMPKAGKKATGKNSARGGRTPRRRFSLSESDADAPAQ